VQAVNNVNPVSAEGRNDECEVLDEAADLH
jgi:hypothetical protein